MQVRGRTTALEVLVVRDVQAVVAALSPGSPGARPTQAVARGAAVSHPR